MVQKLLTFVKVSIRTIIPRNAYTTLRDAYTTLRERITTWKFRCVTYMKRPNLYTLKSTERSGVLYLADTHLTFDERQILFALIRGIRPERVLEIGSFHGGSASIICAAMEDNGKGKLIGIDPEPAISTPQQRFFGRFELIEGISPTAITIAREHAGGSFDLAHLDGINMYDQAIKDLEGTLPHLKDEAYILVNNPFHYGVNRAISEFVEKHNDIMDCGFLSQTVDTEVDPDVAYAGLRLLRHFKNPIADPQPIIERCYKESNLPSPKPNLELSNHDVWFCKHIQPCPHCSQKSDNLSNQ